jgi:pyrimidine operon attenuation protein / uracil phosphoribosyltransferase
MQGRFNASEVNKAIDTLVHQIAAALPMDCPVNLIGIRTRGQTLAARLSPLLERAGFTQLSHATLDITLYRDDLSEIGPRPLVRPTQMDIEIDGRVALLIDDVLFTGRSVRAALDAISDFGRPSAIRLAVLVDRGGRELPIQADFVGITLKQTPNDHRVNVRFTEDDGADEITVEPRGT